MSQGFFGSKDPKDLAHPREKERLQSPLLVLIFGFIGVCFDLISFWGTLAVADFFSSLADLEKNGRDGLDQRPGHILET